MSDLGSSLPLAGGTLDRCDENRNDIDWLAARWSEAKHWIVTGDGRLLADPARREPLLLTAAQLPDRLRRAATDVGPHGSVLLGRDGDGCVHFAAQMATSDKFEEGAADDAPSIGLREAAMRWDAAHSAAFAHAAAVFAWRGSMKFCPQCGSLLQPYRAGHGLRCVADHSCPEQFPRTDPVIIVLVTHQDRCLLGRQASWPAGTYSALAGFVEPGESLEEAVAREVAEESGVRVASARYRGSQPWPFPHSLMIGFHAVAADPTICRGDELEDVRWFSVEQLRSGLESGVLRPPTSISISSYLLRCWLAEHPDPESNHVLDLIGRQ